MRLGWKKLSLIGVVIAALAACDKSAPISPSELSSSRSSELGSSRDGFAGLLTTTAAPALAGNGAPRGQHVFNWNLIGTPHGYDGGCGDGHRIFVERDAKGAQIVVKDEEGVGWSIADCNATSDHQAVMYSDDLGHYNVYARILGKPGGDLTVCVDLVSD